VELGLSLEGIKTALDVERGIQIIGGWRRDVPSSRNAPPAF
jgi:hypothetical protein